MYLHASSFLKGDAGRFYDNLQKNPKTWNNFVEVMKEKYGERKLEKPQRMIRFLSKKQKKGDKTIDFVNGMIRLGEKDIIKKTLIVQTILSNLLRDKKFYKAQIKNNFKILKLRMAVNVIKDEENNDLNIKEDEEKDKKLLERLETIKWIH